MKRPTAVVRQNPVRAEEVSAGRTTGVEKPAEVPERWSPQRKMDLVLRVLRGEPLYIVSRDSQVPAHQLEKWRRTFLGGPRSHTRLR